jgi:hypothetical protein
VSFTVVPLHILELPTGTVIPFGKFSIQHVPEWLLKEPILDRLSAHGRDGVHSAKQAFVSEYEAVPAPDQWKGCGASEFVLADSAIN